MKKYTLNASERLKNRKSIELVFSGKSASLYEGNIGLRYIITPQKEYSVQVGFSVSKRFYKKAHDRNLLKKWMREAYRVRKIPIYEIANEKRISISLFLIIHRKWEKANFNEIETALDKLITKFSLKLQRIES